MPHPLRCILVVSLLVSQPIGVARGCWWLGGWRPRRAASCPQHSVPAAACDGHPAESCRESACDVGVVEVVEVVERFDGVPEAPGAGTAGLPESGTPITILSEVTVPETVSDVGTPQPVADVAVPQPAPSRAEAVETIREPAAVRSSDGPRPPAAPAPAPEPVPEPDGDNIFEEVDDSDSAADAAPYPSAGPVSHGTAAAPHGAGRVAPSPREPARRWIDRSGGYAVVGTLLDVRDGTCVIESQRRTIAVPLESLSRFDREYAGRAARRVPPSGSTAGL